MEALNSLADHGDAIRGIHVPGEPNPSRDRQEELALPRHNTLRNFHGDVNGVSAEVRAYRFGQFALATLGRQLPGLFSFPTATQFAADHFGMYSPLNVHSGGGGGTSGADVFVPDEFGTDLIRLRETYGVARRLCRMKTMSSDTKTDPRRSSGLTAYFVGENAAGTESDAKYDDVRLTAKKLMAITRMSAELAEDAVIDIGDELAGEISYAFAQKEDDCLFNGDGASTYGGILGVINRLQTLTAGTAPGLIAGDGNSWSALTLANFEAVVGALPTYADGPNSRWMCHKTFYYTVMVKLILASGGTTATEIVNGRRVPVFLGYPVEFSQVMPSATSASQVPAVLGDCSMGATFGDRRRESIEFSTQATVGGQSLWERDQIAVKGTERFDINVHSFGTDSAAGPFTAVETTS